MDTRVGATPQQQQRVPDVPAGTSHGLHLALSVIGLLTGWIPAFVLGVALAPLGVLPMISVGLLCTFGWPVVWALVHDRNQQAANRIRIAAYGA